MPETVHEAVSSSSEAHMASRFGGVGRPTHDESRSRRRQFVGLVAAGVDFRAAAKQARVSPERALEILNEPEMRQVIAQVAA